MPKDETQLEETLEETTPEETPEETTEETPETTTDNPEPETETKDQDYRAKLNATNRFLEKEGYEFKEGKWQRKPDTSKEEPEQPEAKPDTLTREEAVAFAKGFSEAEVDKAKKIAQVEDISLPQALESDLFTTWKAAQDKAKKDEEAQLRASGGGGQKTKKDFDTPGLSDEDHKALFKDKMGQ